MGRCCLLVSELDRHLGIRPVSQAQYLARGLPCERFTAALASRTSCITRGRGGWLDLPRGGPPPPILCQLSSRTPLWVLCHEYCRSTRRRATEGGPFEVGNQVLISSHRKLLSSKAMVVSVAERPGQDSGRQG